MVDRKIEKKDYDWDDYYLSNSLLLEKVTDKNEREILRETLRKLGQYFHEINGFMHMFPKNGQINYVNTGHFTKKGVDLILGVESMDELITRMGIGISAPSIDDGELFILQGSLRKLPKESLPVERNIFNHKK